MFFSNEMCLKRNHIFRSKALSLSPLLRQKPTVDMENVSRFDDQSHHDKTDLSDPRPET